MLDITIRRGRTERSAGRKKGRGIRPRPCGRGEDGIARVSVLADELADKGVRGETITSLFGPFYTASIYVSWDDTTTRICDERGVMIASRNTRNNPEWVLCPTAEEMQFRYIVNQIYSKACSEARVRLTSPPLFCAGKKMIQK